MPIQWPEPATWPWPVYVSVALLVFSLLRPLWHWLRRKRAEGWPVAEGHVESADVTEGKGSWYTQGGSDIVAIIGYSYSIAGTCEAGWYRRGFPFETDAREFVRDLKGKPVAVHYNPDKPFDSRLSESALEMLLRNRAPVSAAGWLVVEDTFPNWATPLLWIFMGISAIGLIVSLWVHLGAVLGQRVAPESLFFTLHIGTFVVWIPAVFAGQKLTFNVARKYYWKVVLKSAPVWMLYMTYGFFAYAAVNFLLSITQMPHGSGSSNVPAAGWRLFSGHWMAFYSAALATLYSAAHAKTNGWRCPNGHFVPLGGPWCERCGQQAPKDLRAAKLN